LGSLQPFEFCYFFAKRTGLKLAKCSYPKVLSERFRNIKETVFKMD